MTRRLKKILVHCALLALAGVSWRRSLARRDVEMLLASTSVTIATGGTSSATSADPCTCCGGRGCCRSGLCCYSPGTTGTLSISIVLPACSPQPPKFRYPNDDEMVHSSGAGADCDSKSPITMHRGSCAMRNSEICSAIDAGDCSWTSCFDWTDVSVADGTAGTPRTGCLWVAVRDNAGVTEWKWGLYSSSVGGFVENLSTDWTEGGCDGFSFVGDLFGMNCIEDGHDPLPVHICLDFSIDHDPETNHCHYDEELDDCVEELI